MPSKLDEFKSSSPSKQSSWGLVMSTASPEEQGFWFAVGWVAFGVCSGENGRALGSRHLLGVRFGDVWWGVVELGVTTEAAGLRPGQVDRALFGVGVVIAGSLLLNGCAAECRLDELATSAGVVSRGPMPARGRGPRARVGVLAVVLRRLSRSWPDVGVLIVSVVSLLRRAEPPRSI